MHWPLLSPDQTQDLLLFVYRIFGAKYFLSLLFFAKDHQETKQNVDIHELVINSPHEMSVIGGGGLATEPLIVSVLHAGVFNKHPHIHPFQAGLTPSHVYQSRRHCSADKLN